VPEGAAVTESEKLLRRAGLLLLMAGVHDEKVRAAFPAGVRQLTVSAESQLEKETPCPEHAEACYESALEILTISSFFSFIGSGERLVSS
jgi:hypothetical protein